MSTEIVDKLTKHLGIYRNTSSRTLQTIASPLTEPSKAGEAYAEAV